MSTILRGNLYVCSYALGVALLLLITVCRRKAYKTSVLRAAAYCFITFLFGLCGAMLAGLLYDLIALIKHIHATMFVDVIGAVIFTSPFLLAAVYTEKAVLKRRALKAAEAGTELEPRRVSFRDTMDLVIPGAFVVFACIKAGCFIRGCCFGVEWGWGVTAQFYYGKTVFPVQIFESASILAIAAASHFVQKAAFYRRGMSGPLAAFAYGTVRFFWEFFRYNPPELRSFFSGLTIWQLFCILIWIVAGIWIRLLIKTQPREPLPKTPRIKRPAKKKDQTERHNTKGRQIRRAKRKKTHKKRK